jgi:hypothetical protein
MAKEKISRTIAQTPAIHMSLQGKGGVGKSVIASLLAQYWTARGHTVTCIDTDPVNRTLFQYEGLDVQCLKLLREGGVDARGFDALMESILTTAGTFVVDNGASTFVPLWNYMLENNVFGLLRESGKHLFLHTVITGGQALGHTLDGFERLAATTAEKNIVVWINEYFGRVEHEGKEFPDMTVARNNQQKILGSIALPRRNQDTFGRDIQEVMTRKLTFDEAIQCADFSIMSKQRLKIVQREVFEQLDTLAFA